MRHKIGTASIGWRRHINLACTSMRATSSTGALAVQAGHARKDAWERLRFLACFLSRLRFWVLVTLHPSHQAQDGQQVPDFEADCGVVRKMQAQSADIMAVFADHKDGHHLPS